MTGFTEVGTAPKASGRRRGPWLGAAVALVVVLAIGLIWVVSTSNGDEPSEPGTNASASTTVAPAGETPPPLRNTGEDFTAVYTSLNDFQGWVFQHPDPKWTESTTDPRCECYATTQAGLASLKSKSHHHTGPGLKVNRVEVRDRLSKDQVTLYVVVEGLPESIVDANGAVVQPAPNLSPTGFLEELVRGTDGRWRILQETVLGPPEGSVQ